MNDLELAIEYRPYILFDQNEPFNIKKIGYSVFRQTKESASFHRLIEIDEKTIAFVIEYAVYFDYDIQHLYDLEHIWIFVGYDGLIKDAEASFHGYYLKSLILENKLISKKRHLNLYCQPGKHAFLPDSTLFRIMPNWYIACNEQAGATGILIMDMFTDEITATKEQQRLACRYIKENFAFEPTLKFELRLYEKECLIPWNQLKELIPWRIKREMHKIENIQK